VIETNLTGTFNMTRAAFNQAMSKRGGAIVNIVAEMWRGFPGMSHTGAARAGVVNLTQTLAVEWASRGVRINAVAPGYIYGHGITQYDPAFIEQVLATINDDIPAKRMGTESEVAAAVTFLLSPAAAYITGETIRVDGGSSLWRKPWDIPEHNNLGLNLFACFDCAQLPTPIVDIIAANDFDPQNFSRLLLIGHGGRRLWEEIQHRDQPTEDPFDDISVALTRQFLRDYLGDPPVHFIYPETAIPLPLQQLGMLAGWHHPSPLGVGINGVYGLWFAYRAAVLTTDVLMPTLPMNEASPCETCVERPCITACPADAVSTAGNFQAGACFSQRLMADSSCGDRCHSRLACPYFVEHRYSDEQMGYHYGLSLASIRKYSID